MTLIVAALQILGSIVATLYGFHAVGKRLDDGLKTKVDLSVYQSKVKELHDIINHERDQRVAVETEVRLLKETLKAA
jgi:hypothetical protein